MTDDDRGLASQCRKSVQVREREEKKDKKKQKKQNTLSVIKHACWSVLNRGLLSANRVHRTVQ